MSHDPRLPSPIASPAQRVVRVDSQPQTTAEDLGRSIVTGRYDIEVFPSEQEITQRYGVSRATARDAVKILAARRLILPRAGGRRAVVATQDQWPLFDQEILGWLLKAKGACRLRIELMQVRRSVEPAAAAMAAASALPVQRGAIEAALATLEGASGREEVRDAEFAFHAAILDASGNRFFQQIRSIVAATLELAPVEDAQPHLEARDRAAERLIADAIRNHDPARAQAAMAEVLDRLLSEAEAAAPAKRSMRYIPRYGPDA